MILHRRTLRHEVRFEGRGLHSGNPVVVRFVPSSYGIRFSLGSEFVKAIPANVTDTTRCTRLGSISTIEHAMAALAGREITDLDIVLTAPEMPALDGSSKVYVESLQQEVFEPLGETEIPDLFSRVFVQEPNAKVALSAGNGHWRYEFSSTDVWPKFMEFEALDVVAAFPDEIGPARTFGFEHELPAIRAAGLAQGLDLDSALVIGEAGYMNEARFPDEPARHKLLDAVGDIYLAGVPIRYLNLVAERTGHRMHVAAAQRLRDAIGIST